MTIGRILDAEVEAVAVALLRLESALAGRIAVEHGEQRRCLRRRVDLQPHARRRQRIGGPAAWNAGLRVGRPVAGDEEVEILADEKFGVDDELACPNARLAVEQLTLEPHLGQPRRRQRFDVADRVQAADQHAVRTTAAVQLKSIRVEAQAVPTGQPPEVDADHRFQLPVENGFPRQAAFDVGQQFGRVNEPERHASLGKPVPRAERIAIGGQAGRNRRLRCDARRRLVLGDGRRAERKRQEGGAASLPQSRRPFDAPRLAALEHRHTSKSDAMGRAPVPS